MKTKTPLDYEQEKSLRDAAFVLRNKLESCRFFMAAVGIEHRHWSLSAFMYNSHAGVFDNGNFPSGIGQVRGLAIGYRL